MSKKPASSTYTKTSTDGNPIVAQEDDQVPKEILRQPISKSMDQCAKLIKLSKHKIDIYWFKGTLESQLAKYKHHLLSNIRTK